MGLSFDSNNDLWVVCHDGIGFMIFTENGEFLKEYVSQGNGDGEFISTQGIAVDQSGNIFVSDFYGDRIQIFQENKWVWPASNICSSLYVSPTSSGTGSTIITVWGAGGAEARPRLETGPSSQGRHKDLRWYGDGLPTDSLVSRR